MPCTTRGTRGTTTLRKGIGAIMLVTEKTAREVLARLKNGTATLTQEQKRLGLPGTRVLRRVLVKLLGSREAYREMMTGVREKRRESLSPDDDDDDERQVVEEEIDDGSSDDEDPQDLCTLMSGGQEEERRREFEPSGVAGVG